MTEEEKLSKIADLRKSLADGRSTARTSNDSNGHGEDSHRSSRGGIQAVLGSGGEAGTGFRQLGSITGGVRRDERGTEDESFRERSSPFGSGDDHGHDGSLATETRASGRLVAEDVVRPRTAQEDKAYVSQKSRQRKSTSKANSSNAGQAGPVPTSEQSQAKKRGFKLPDLSDIPGVGKGKTLGKREADDLRDGFRGALEDDFGYIDQWLRAKSGIADLQVWSDVDDEELDKVTDVFLRGAQRSPVLATVVRETINTHDYIVTGMVFLPRLQATVTVLREARARNPRPARWQQTAAKRVPVDPAMNGAAHE